MKKWCNDPYFDEASREELKALEGNEAEIEDRFYRQQSSVPADSAVSSERVPNRMNIYTVRQATPCKLYHFPERTGKKELPSHTIPESCHRNSHAKQRSA